MNPAVPVLWRLLETAPGPSSFRLPAPAFIHRHCSHLALNMAAPTEQQSVDLQAALAEFAARCDPNDPEQVAMLEQMKEHTRRLAQLRGDWEKPGSAGSRRLWNSAKAKTPAPAAIQSLKCVRELDVSVGCGGGRRTCASRSWRVLAHAQAHSHSRCPPTVQGLQGTRGSGAAAAAAPAAACAAGGSARGGTAWRQRRRRRRRSSRRGTRSGGAARAGQRRQLLAPLLLLPVLTASSCLHGRKSYTCCRNATVSNKPEGRTR